MSKHDKNFFSDSTHNNESSSNTSDNNSKFNTSNQNFDNSNRNSNNICNKKTLAIFTMTVIVIGITAISSKY